MAEAVNPATERVLLAVPDDDEAELGRKLDLAVAGFERWRALPVAERAAALKRLAEVLAAGRQRFAEQITAEMGKPVGEALLELDKCVAGCEFFATRGPGFLAEEEVPEAAGLVRYEPLGPVLAVMPWNYPFWQVFRVLPPILVAGNTLVLKHASNVPGCAGAIAEAAVQAGFPEGVVTNVYVPGGRVAALVADPRIAAVTVTGSSEVGAAVAAAAGRAIKKHVLELGGSDAFLVRRDADLEATLAGAMHGRFRNAGQACVGAKRFLVEAAVYDEFAAGLAARVEALRIGDPADPGTELGPLAKREAVATLNRQVEESVAAGAVRVSAEPSLPEVGYFAAPIVLGEVAPGMPAFDEETFGPVAALVRVEGDEEMVELANASPFGLGASVWSGDEAAAREIAARLEVGFVGVNATVASDPALPFGGIRRSGYGRELGRFGVCEFTNVKAVRLGTVSRARR